MNKNVLLIFLVLFTGIVWSQESESKFKLHSADIGFGGFYFKKNYSEGGGISFYASVSSSINNNLMSASFLTGAEIGVVGHSTYNFNEIALQYGREIIIKKWFSFEVFGGIGYYSQRSDTDLIKNDNSISYPLKIDFIFHLNKKIGLGLNSNFSINNVNNNFSNNLIFIYQIN